MKIRMLKTENGSIDGVRVTTYNAGQEYDLTRSAGERDLAAAFVNARMAVEVAEPARPVLHVPAQPDPVPSIEEKAALAPEENKAMPLAPENKRSGKRKG